MFASVEANGAVLLGKNVACDAHFKRPIRVVTHAHLDHIYGLKESIDECETILMTPPTRDLLEVIKSKKLVASPKICCCQYGEPFDYGGEKITLFHANHIIGSAQVLVEADEREVRPRVVYTGDFRIKKIPVIKCDILVMEATYGNPYRRRRFKGEVEEKLIDLIKESLKSSSVYVFGYYGKLQEVLALLYKAGIEFPVVVPEKVFKMMQVCERYGMKFGKYFCSKDFVGANGRSPLQLLDRFIGLYHMGSKQWIGKDSIKITLSGWEFKEPVKQESEKEFTVAFSDHADFDELMEYVEISKPHRVITDASRVGDAPTLAQEIRKKFGIPATPMPV